MIYVVAILCETLSFCLLTQAQLGEICDAAARLQHNGCLYSKLNHTLLQRERCTFSSVHPRGTIHCVSDVEYLSSQPFSQLSAALTLLHSDKSKVVSWVKKKKRPVG